MSYITTNQLTKELNTTRAELIVKLQRLEFIDHKGKLTKRGIKNGGEYKNYMGTEYISWQDKDKIINLLNKKQTILGKIFNRDKSNNTKEQKEQKKEKSKKNIKKNIDPRKSYKEPQYRTEDGHYVRSKAELIIDNWLYHQNIVHAYEKRLPTEENLLSDFYLPQGKVYIEFWGYENQEAYIKRKKIKQQIYKKYNFKLIELNDKEVQNLDDILPKILLKFNIQAY
ncbi:hypothetical protein MNB_SV-12-769 [hydrothermal vent metagenome]|uniref:Glycerol kinase n=1 Tax=hydrothermal vent metagenome TaxID=652676 RepID=A0A1W1BDB0_9ZZZZ